MRRTALLASVAGLACLAALTAAFAYGGPHRDGFRLPDASAACRIESGTLVCRSLGVRAGLALPAHAAPRAVGGRIWWDASTPVLARWRGGGVDCRTAGGAILCTNAGGAAIRVGPRQIAVAL